MTDNIPVIDINDLASTGTRATIDRACRDWGFFQVIGHGLDPGLCRSLSTLSHELFGQPEAIKRRLLRTADNPWGYFDQELTKNRRDWKEIYDFGPNDGGGARRLVGPKARCVNASSQPCASITKRQRGSPGDFWRP